MEVFMKTILGLCLGLIAFSAVVEAKTEVPMDPGSSYELKLELAVDSKQVASTKLLVNSDQKAVIRQKSGDGKTYIVEVLLHPDDSAKKIVTMNFTVSTETADGKSEVIDTARVTAKERKGATITITKSDGSEKMSLKVWAKKIAAKK
jgi:hypothetical protein